MGPGDDSHADAQVSSRKKSKSKPQLVTFRRNEIIFDNRKCIMLNLRDVTDQENMIQVLENNKTGRKMNAELNKELFVPLKTIERAAT